MKNNNIMENRMEYAKCYSDKSRVYMIEKYFKIRDYTQGGYVNLKLLPKQIELLEAIELNKKVIAPKSRQVGATTVLLAKIACEIVLATEGKPENILIINPNLDLSRMSLKKIKEFLLQVPRWFWGERFYGSEENDERSIFVKDNNKNLELFNGSRIHSSSSMRSYKYNSLFSIDKLTPATWLVFDEASFINEGSEVYSQALSAVAPDAHTMIVSTPNGKDELFYNIYEKTIKKENDFKVVELKWFQDPRYNKNLTWHKVNEQTGDGSVIVIKTIKEDGSVEYKPEYWESLLRNGYKPTSDWYLKMCNNFNNDKQKIDNGKKGNK